MATAASPDPIGPLEEHEIPAFFDTDSAAFGQRMSSGVREMVERIMSRQRIVANRDGAELVGTAASEASEMTVPGLRQVPTAMVVGVSVIPTHRRQGRLTSLMRYQLDDIHGRGEPIASLYASEGGIYGRFGYGQATFGSQYTLDKRTARLARPASDFGDGRIRLLTRDQAAEAFPAVFAEYALTRAGEFKRDEIGYLTALGEPGGEDLSRRWYAAYEADGSIDGYVGYEIKSVDTPGSRDRQVVVRELCALNNGAYVALWQYLLGIDLTVELSVPWRPTDEPIRWLLTDPRQLRTVRTNDRTWVRLVDTAAALGERSYAETGDLVVGVTDEFCSWNSARYRIVVAEDWGRAEVTITDAAADLEVDAAALASMYLGGVQASALATVGRVRGVSPGAVARATRMFANDAPPFSVTMF